MNRPMRIIVLVVFFWGNATLAFSGICCCPMDTLGLIKCLHDGCRTEYSVSACDNESAASGDCRDRCVFFKCAQDLSPIGLYESEAVLPQHLALALPTAIIAAKDSLNAAWLNPNPIFSPLKKPVSPLLQTCSFLS